MLIRLLPAVALFVLSLATASAATAAESSVQGHPCTAVADPAERLACYDAAFPPSAGARPGNDIKAEKEQALRDFGLTQVQLRGRDPERMREVSPRQIEAAVTHIGIRPTGQRVVTLDSGQIWLLTEVTSKGYLIAGDQVVVRDAALGSYMLVTPKGVPLRARRIK